MAWTLNPTHRPDLPLELYDVLDASGNYTGDWIESVDTEAVRVAALFNGGSPVLAVEEGQYDPGASGGTPRVLRVQNLSASGLRVADEVKLTCRYYRLVATGGASSGTIAATVRRV